MHHDDDLNAPRLVTIGRGRFWLFDDGSTLPLISGGATDTDDEDDDEDDDEQDDSGRKKSDDEDDDEDDDEFDPDRAKRDMRKKNRENANLRRRLKEAEKAESELKKIRDKEKSAGERLTETTDKLTAAEMKVARLEVALEKGLTLAQANRLSGSTKDELLEDADDYLAELGQDDDDDETPTKKPKTTRRPKEKVRRSGTGTTDTDDDDEDDPRALAAKVRRRF